MPYLLDQPTLANFPPYIVFKEQFTPEQCSQIIEIGKQAGLQPALIGTDQSNKVDKKKRSSLVSWLHWNAETNWVFERLTLAVNDARQNWYPFHLSGFMEPIQITHYRSSQKGHYDWHQDMGPAMMSKRKLSLVCLLSPEEAFSGGNLELFNIHSEEKTAKELKQGSIICFPSWEPHRVTKVTKGERWSLVSWVHGPPFV